MIRTALLSVTLLVAVAATAIAATPALDKAKAQLDPAAFAFFQGEIKDSYPEHVKLYAIASATVEKAATAPYCPMRTAQCGMNPTCNHPKRTVATVDLKIGTPLFKVGEADLPKAFTNYALFDGGGDLKAGDAVQVSLYVYAAGNDNVSKIRKAEAAVAPDKPAVPPAAPLVITIKEKDTALTTGPVAIGSKIEVHAAGNPTTGYSWAVKEVKGDAVKAGEVKYTPTPVAPKIVGSGGEFTIPLEAVKAGKAEVIMVYARPWEKDQPPAQSVTLTVEVQAGADPKAAPKEKADAPAAPPAKRANPLPIGGKADPRAPNFIVLFENNVADAKAEVTRLEKALGFKNKYVYDMPGFKGFAAALTNEAVEKLRWDPNIKSIEHDGVASINGGVGEKRAY
jgi:inhibitor of cysteine peptidase